MRSEDVKTIIYYYYDIPGIIRLLKEERNDLEDAYNGLRGISMDGMPHGSTVGRPTEMLAEQADSKNALCRIQEVSVKIHVLECDAALIRRCLDDLNSKYKRLISLRYQYNYSWAKIAVRTGMPDSTVRNRHDKVIARLTEALSDVPMVDELASRASRARL